MRTYLDCLPCFLSQAFRAARIATDDEAPSSERRPIFFLLKAKCRVITDDIGVQEGDIVLKMI